MTDKSPNTDETDHGARVIVALRENYARILNKKGLQFTANRAFDPLKEVLNPEHASLSSVPLDHEYYVQVSDAHGAEDSPIIAWSRDNIEAPGPRAYYANRFIVTMGTGQKILSTEHAHALQGKLRELVGQGVVEEVRAYSMDPAQNTALPKRYTVGR